MKSLGPSMPFYVDDFIGGTQGFDAAQVGAYVLLLLQQWQRGYVTEHMHELMRISRLKHRRQLIPVLGKFYRDEDGHYRNRKMELIRAERMDYIRSQAEKGKWKRGNRGSTDVSTGVSTGGQPEDLSASPSPILIHTNGGFTLDQCLAAAQSIGMKRSDVEAFFNHYDQYDWMGSQNRRITRLHSALARWKQNQSSHAQGVNGKRQRPSEPSTAQLMAESDAHYRKAIQ